MTWIRPSFFFFFFNDTAPPEFYPLSLHAPLPIGPRAGAWDLFFFNDTATTEIYTLPLHDALPICPQAGAWDLDRVDDDLAAGRLDCRQRLVDRRHADRVDGAGILAGLAWPDAAVDAWNRQHDRRGDRKSTRLNSSHGYISYAVFCL